MLAFIKVKVLQPPYAPKQVPLNLIDGNCRGNGVHSTYHQEQGEPGWLGQGCHRCAISKLIIRWLRWHIHQQCGVACPVGCLGLVDPRQYRAFLWRAAPGGRGCHG